MRRDSLTKIGPTEGGDAGVESVASTGEAETQTRVDRREADSSRRPNPVVEQPVTAPDERAAESGATYQVAALYVYPDGIYAGLPDVDIWDESRDARLYCGPHPAVAHPPCARWSLMGLCRGYYDGEDGGCFAAAHAAVRRYGGVLEHPAHSLAWKRFGLPKPPAEGWAGSLFDGGWSCEVDQRWYGHEANKPTWLWYVGLTPPPNLKWGRAPRGEKTVGRSWGQGRDRQRSGTPPAFRDVLLDMARNAMRPLSLSEVA